jgi:DNA-binding NarL/FixJ family response regulator
MTLTTTTLLVCGPARALVEALSAALRVAGGIDVVGSSTSVEQSVEKARSCTPDVVLVCADADYWDGLRVCSEIKRFGAATRVVVIGLDSDDSALLAAVKAGADGYVTVAESVDALGAALRQVAAGESRIPPGMLGALLRGLIEFRREDDAALERFATLGKREREVLAELVAGRDLSAIASKLHLSPHTARSHTQNILSKLGVHSRLDAARMVAEHDLLSRFGIGDGDGAGTAREDGR